MSRLSKFLSNQGLRSAGQMDMARLEAKPDQCVPGPGAGPIERAFFAHKGPLIHKWHHYLPLYDRYFKPFLEPKGGEPLRFLEIGVSGGGSISMWRNYFGKDAIIFGIDIDETCSRLDEVCGGSIRIGSQDDPDFLLEVVDEMGGQIDIVLDDGSHISRHMNRSFEILFPHLKDGGIYMVEDLHCAYWRNYEGGHRKPGTFIETTKDLIDDMHHWWHSSGQKVGTVARSIGGIHFHDSIVVIEKKAEIPRPVHSMHGDRLR